MELYLGRESEGAHEEALITGDVPFCTVLSSIRYLQGMPRIGGVGAHGCALFVQQGVA